jgi:hypothetical protein
VNPADADLAEDRPFRASVVTAKELRDGWWRGKIDAQASTELLGALRSGTSADASTLTAKLLNRGVAPQSIFDGIFAGAGELLMQAPGIVSLHSMTFTNAIHYSFQRAKSDEVRRLLMLQNAAFLPLYRGNRKDSGVRIDALESLPSEAKGDEAVAEIFADMSKDRMTAARKMLGFLKEHENAAPLASAARRLIFLKGNNAHDYKFSSAVLEDYETLSSPWRERMLAASAFLLRGSGDKDNDLVARTRAAVA